VTSSWSFILQLYKVVFLALRSVSLIEKYFISNPQMYALCVMSHTPIISEHSVTFQTLYLT